jgi:hypothetical protein
MFAPLIKHCKHFIVFQATECKNAINLLIFKESSQIKTLHTKPLRVKCGRERKGTESDPYQGADILFPTHCLNHPFDVYQGP